MSVYVSMLRGINVGGQRKVRMEELLEVYRKAGLREARSYVQSGNVVFGYDGRADALAGKLETGILKAFGFPVVVIIRTPEELGNVVRGNPFLEEDNSKLHVTFFSAGPGRDSLKALEGVKSGRDRFAVIGKEAYLFCPDGYGRTKYSNDFFERKLGLSATTRNWNTVNRLLEMAEEAG
jgi:uncharacterized protein (DUF1697 family)